MSVVERMKAAKKEQVRVPETTEPVITASLCQLDVGVRRHVNVCCLQLSNVVVTRLLQLPAIASCVEARS